MDGKLSGAQMAMLLQEETLRRNEQERKTLVDKLATVERSLHTADSERRAMQVRGVAREKKAEDAI